MDTSAYIFSYNPENLSLFSYTFPSGGLFMPTIVIVMSILYFLGYIFMPYIYGYIILIRQQREKNEKKQVIKDLVMMNDIQTELEKEIEQSLLNIAMKK